MKTRRRRQDLIEMDCAVLRAVCGGADRFHKVQACLPRYKFRQVDASLQRLKRDGFLVASGMTWSVVGDPNSAPDEYLDQFKEPNQ